jgi:Fic family protein
MEQIIVIFIVGVLCGFMVAWVWCGGEIKELENELKRMQREIEKERQMLGGFDEYNKKIAEIKQKRKEKIIEELKKRGKMQTNKVADLLDISKVTAFRYLEELQQEGEIEQVGAFGRGVEYKIKVVK